MLDKKAVFYYNRYVIYKKNIERTDFIEVTYNGDEKVLNSIKLLLILGKFDGILYL